MRSLSASPLDTIEWKAGAELALTDHFSIALQGIQLNQRTNNPLALTGVPSTDRTYDFIGHYKSAGEDISLTLGRRQALTEFYTQALSAEFGRGTALRFTFQAGRNQFADESQEIQIGGVKDLLRGEFEWDVVPRIYVRGGARGRPLLRARPPAHRQRRVDGRRDRLPLPDRISGLDGAPDRYARQLQFAGRRRAVPAAAGAGRRDPERERLHSAGVFAVRHRDGVSVPTCSIAIRARGGRSSTSA
ncbi:MAG: hypothetical protein WDN30_10795 [Pararobbsia sp.]